MKPPIRHALPLLLLPLLSGAGPLSQGASSRGADDKGEVSHALESVADTFAARLAEPSRSMGGAGPLALSLEPAGDSAAPLVPLLRGLLPERVAGRATYTQVVWVSPGIEGLAEAREMGAAAHLEARLHASADDLVLAGVLQSTWINLFTGRPRGIEPVVVEARARADQSTRTLIRSASGERPRGGALQLRRIAGLSGRPIAATVGDLTGDGRGEIVVLLEESLVVISHDAEEGPREVARRDLVGRPRALVTSRDPTGGVAVTELGRHSVIVYNHSTLATGEVLSFDGGILKPLATISEHPVASSRDGTVVYARLNQGTNLFTGPLRVAGPGGGDRIELRHPILAAATGPLGRDLLVVDHRYRLLRATSGDKEVETASVGPVGSALTLARLAPGDGLLQVSSAARPPSSEDRLVISELSGRTLELRPVEGAIRAIAAGDVTGRGRDEVVVLTKLGEESRVLLLAEADQW